MCHKSDPDICGAYFFDECLKVSFFFMCPRFCGYCKNIIQTTTSSTITSTIKQNVSITRQEFETAFRLTGYPIPSYIQYVNFVKNAEPNGGITTKRELAMFLAQIMWESGGLQYIEEINCISNGCPGNYRTSDDFPGAHYYGRGYIQLSWVYNYKAASIALFNDLRLYTNPELVSQNDDIAWVVSFWYWKENVHSKPGIADGLFGVSTNAINGQLECNGGPYQYKAMRRFDLYKNVLRAFQITDLPIESGCY